MTTKLGSLVGNLYFYLVGILRVEYTVKKTTKKPSAYLLFQ